ncbi:MAG: DHH family phosphoesterase [Clostridia bacterium]|nr:DHH family phosphoesterase [Clostridia bacterium]
MGKHNKNPKLYIVSLTVVSMFAIICMAIITLMMLFTDIAPARILLITVGVYAFVSGVGVFLYFFITSRVQRFHAVDDNVTDLECNLTLNFLSELYMPVVLVNAQKKIIWYNQSFSDKVQSRGGLYGKSFADYCPVSTEELLESDNMRGLTVQAFGAYFNIKAHNLPFNGENMVLTTWNDCTELILANKKLEDEEPLVAFIVIDNLEDLMQYAQESYRSASARVEEILRSWADSIDGIFREYERDKFILVFQAHHLAQFVSTKFDILDKIRDVRVGASNLPVTISIGISTLDGNLCTKEKNSRSALDTALQRGGDQVVLKTSEGTEFYGGKVQTANRRSKVRARVVAEELSHQMAQAENVLIMAHAYPDYDAIGASVGIARLAEYCGARFNIVTNFTSGDFKKCEAKLAGYSDSGVFVDVSTAKDLMTSGTLLVIVDVNNPTQFEAAKLADMASNIAVIDHHRKAAQFGYEPKVTYIEPAASSTSEMVAELLEHVLAPGLLTKDIADILLAGIMLDTKQFSRNTGARTFGAALYLRNEGANPTTAGELFYTELNSLTSEADYESNVVIYRSSIAIAQNSEAQPNEAVGRVAAAKAADKMLNVIGIEASFVACYTQDAVHISARSNGRINVQLIVEKLGGGGHFDSAATRLTNVSLTEALTMLKKAIDEYLSETKEEK